MKHHIAACVALAAIVVGIGTLPAFGQTGSFDVFTDKPSYLEGETVMIMGTVSELYDGVPVNVIITAPNGNVIGISQETVTRDKTFTMELITGGVTMKQDGTYTVTVTYGVVSHSILTTFEYETFREPEIIPEGETVEGTVVVEEVDALISYSVTGGKLTSITFDAETAIVTIPIVTANNGSMTVTLPRTVFDSSFDGEDIAVVVLVDGGVADVVETVTPIDRTLTIEFPAGAESVEIVGTWAIPEFGAVAAIMLMVSIIAVVAVSAKSKLGIVQRC